MGGTTEGFPLFSKNPRDISELTRQVNHLDAALNQFSEENEVLRGKLGLGAQESVDVSGVRGRRAAEVERLRKDNRMLQNEVSVAMSKSLLHICGHARCNECNHSSGHIML